MPQFTLRIYVHNEAGDEWECEVSTPDPVNEAVLMDRTALIPEAALKSMLESVRTSPHWLRVIVDEEKPLEQLINEASTIEGQMCDLPNKEEVKAYFEEKIKELQDLINFGW